MKYIIKPFFALTIMLFAIIGWFIQAIWDWKIPKFNPIDYALDYTEDLFR